MHAYSFSDDFSSCTPNLSLPLHACRYLEQQRGRLREAQAKQREAQLAKCVYVCMYVRVYMCVFMWACVFTCVRLSL